MELAADKDMYCFIDEFTCDNMITIYNFLNSGT